MPIEKTDLAGLATYIVSEIPAGSRPELAVVLCHGYGATGQDLVGLTQEIGAVRPGLMSRVAFLHPAGPLELMDAGISFGRAWWPIDLDRLLNRPTPELLARFRHDCPDGMPEAGAVLGQLIADAGRELNLSADRFVLGGFSQGAMLATDVALRMDSAPAALCILSGALTNENQWRELAKQRGPLNVLQSHGRRDPILMYSQATALRDLLCDAGCEVDFVSFDGYHEIPPAAIHRLAELLDRVARQLPD
jgi:phospholipase/carboxylesterase